MREHQGKTLWLTLGLVAVGLLAFLTGVPAPVFGDCWECYEGGPEPECVSNFDYIWDSCEIVEKCRFIIFCTSYCKLGGFCDQWPA